MRKLLTKAMLLTAMISLQSALATPGKTSAQARSLHTQSEFTPPLITQPGYFPKERIPIRESIELRETESGSEWRARFVRGHGKRNQNVCYDRMQWLARYLPFNARRWLLSCQISQ